MSVPEHGWITSLILVAVLLTVRYFLIRAVRRKSKSDILSKDQRVWLSRIKNTTIILLVFGLVLIWAPQLQAIALSLTAVAVALVVATKEMILCLTGAFMRVTTQPFKVGDWVRIDDAAGEVVDINALAFLIQEVDIAGRTYQFTGRIIEIPNGKLFTSTIENLTFMKKYVFLDIPFAFQYGDVDPARVLDGAEAILRSHYAPLADDARKYNRKVEKKAGIDIADPEPHVYARTTDLGHMVFTARMFVPTPQAAAIGRAVTHEILSLIYREKTRAREDGEPAPENTPENTRESAPGRDAGPFPPKKNPGKAPARPRDGGED